MNGAARAKHSNWISAPAKSYDPYGRSYVGAVTVDEAIALERLHAAAAELAETEGRWPDAASEWEQAGAMVSKAATMLGPVEKEKAFLRFKEYKRRGELAASRALDKGPGVTTIALLIAAAVGGIYAAYSPSGAASLARAAGSKVTSAGRAGIAKFRRVTP